MGMLEGVHIRLYWQNISPPAVGSLLLYVLGPVAESKLELVGYPLVPLPPPVEIGGHDFGSEWAPYENYGRTDRGKLRRIAIYI